MKHVQSVPNLLINYKFCWSLADAIKFEIHYKKYQ